VFIYKNLHLENYTIVLGGDKLKKKKSKLVCYLLALFLGVFGAHLFYVGSGREELFILYSAGLIFL
jgi:TM2 domain-containing membrane protein YozV